jgi:hypothetical protein
MGEQQPREIRRSRQPEIVNPLTLTLSETAQRGVLQNLRESLRLNTHAETNGYFRNRPDVLAELDETRKVAVQLVNNLGIEIHPIKALGLGLTDLLPEGQLEQFARKDQWRTDVVTQAQYFLEKKPPEPKP